MIECSGSGRWSEPVREREFCSLNSRAIRGTLFHQRCSPAYNDRVMLLSRKWRPWLFVFAVTFLVPSLSAVIVEIREYHGRQIQCLHSGIRRGNGMRHLWLCEGVHRNCKVRDRNIRYRQAS